MSDQRFSLFSGGEVTAHNRDVWDRRAKAGARFTAAAPDASYAKAAETLRQNPWLPDSVAGLKVLCLASGGGGQSGVFASLGAMVTVVDVSPAMLENDLKVARKHGFDVRVVEASMDQMPMLQDGWFDLVVHPVSTCYLPNVQDVFDEVARVCKAGAIYVSHHKQPMSMQASAEPVGGTYRIEEPYRTKTPLPFVSGKMHREDGALEFLHSWQDLLGGICRAGFVIDDFSEADHADPAAAPGSFGHRSTYVPPFMSIRAIRKESASASGLILPR